MDHAEYSASSNFLSALFTDFTLAGLLRALRIKKLLQRAAKQAQRGTIPFIVCVSVSPDALFLCRSIDGPFYMSIPGANCLIIPAYREGALFVLSVADMKSTVCVCY